jgi:hypothetical protein
MEGVEGMLLHVIQESQMPISGHWLICVTRTRVGVKQVALRQACFGLDYDQKRWEVLCDAK